MAREVERVGQRPADRRVDRGPVDLRRPERVAGDAGVRHRQAAERRRDEHVVVREHGLDRVEHPRAQHLVAVEVGHAGLHAPVHPAQVGVGQLVAVGAEEIEPALAQPLEHPEVQRRDQPAPEVAELALVGGQRDLDLLDLGARVGERLHRLRDDRGDRRIDGEAAEVRAVGDPHPGDRPLDRAERIVVEREAERVARIGARERREREGGVGHGPRQQPLEHERARAAERVRAADERDPAEGLLEAVDPAPRRGDPHRTAAVGPLRERQQPVGHRRGAAARRPAAVARGVERVAGRPEEDVVARRTEAHHRAVRLADHDRAGGLHPLGPHARRVDHVVAQRRDPAERGRPPGLEVEQVLDRGRDAVQRPERRTGGDRGVGLARGRARVIEGAEHERVQRGIARLDAGDRRLEQLGGREPPLADRERQLRGRHPGELGHRQERRWTCAYRVTSARMIRP